jgi:hypothetical protein
MKKIKTEIHIAASPETVWRVLVDFARMEWNPMFASVAGNLAVGQRLRVVLREPRLTIKPRVTRVETARLLEWRGNPGVPGLVDGQHYFELSPSGVGTTFRHGETFTGLLVPLLGGLMAKAERSFIKLNQALKNEAEKNG